MHHLVMLMCLLLFLILVLRQFQHRLRLVLAVGAVEDIYEETVIVQDPQQAVVVVFDIPVTMVNHLSS